MKKRNFRLLSVAALLLMFAYIFFGSAKPVEVYTVPMEVKNIVQIVPEVQVVSQNVVSVNMYPQPEWKWTEFITQISVLALLGAGSGIVIGLFSRSIYQLDRVLLQITPAIAAGFVTGVLIGGGSYIWEYLYGYEVMNTIYWMPEGGIDFKRE